MHQKQPFFKSKPIALLAAVLFSVVLNGCTTAHHKENSDPFETFNRQAFALNDTLDKVVLKPTAKVYTTVIPPPVVTGINNAFDNLSMIPTILNDLLQWNIYQALQDNGRLMINSIIGIGGLIDVASHVGYPAHYTDFGITLAKWGVTQSPYLVLPILGPSTIRDAIAIPATYYMSIYPYINPLAARYGLLGLNVLSRRAQLLEFADLIDEITFDPYIFQRNAYLQNRQQMLAKSKEKYDPWAQQNQYEVDEMQSMDNSSPITR